MTVVLFLAGCQRDLTEMISQSLKHAAYAKVVRASVLHMTVVLFLAGCQRDLTEMISQSLKHAAYAKVVTANYTSDRAADFDVAAVTLAVFLSGGDTALSAHSIFVCLRLLLRTTWLPTEPLGQSPR